MPSKISKNKSLSRVIGPYGERFEELDSNIKKKSQLRMDGKKVDPFPATFISFEKI
ncbi:MAG: hypothetical protein K8R13_00170 [Methanococcoides sp.]|nr:hypothetical protein [Methanococcoides sp.]